MNSGDRVKVKTRLYLARWVEAGEQGEIVDVREPGKNIVKLEDGHEYILADRELEICNEGQY